MRSNKIPSCSGTIHPLLTGCGVSGHYSSYYTNEGCDDEADLEEEGHNAKRQSTYKQRQPDVQPPLACDLVSMVRACNSTRRETTTLLMALGVRKVR